MASVRFKQFYKNSYINPKEKWHVREICLMPEHVTSYVTSPRYGIGYEQDWGTDPTKEELVELGINDRVEFCIIKMSNGDLWRVIGSLNDVERKLTAKKNLLHG